MTRKPLKTWRNPGLGATLLAALLLCVGASLAAAPAAFAHDQLISSSPAPDERLDKSPANITLTFSSPLLELGHEVRVVDDNAKNWVGGAGPRPGNADQALPELPDGGYQVSWRVVSADGHPISGSYGFRVGTPPLRPQPPPARPALNPAAATQKQPIRRPAGCRPPELRGRRSGHILVLAGLRRLKRTTQSPSE